MTEGLVEECAETVVVVVLRNAWEDGDGLMEGGVKVENE